MSARPAVQLWSFHYAPEPTGIGPLSALLARELTGRGYDVEVVAAHPHYPEPSFGRRSRPYREWRDGATVLRFPAPGRGRRAAARIAREGLYGAGLLATLPRLGRADAIVAVSPAFASLVPAIAGRRMRGTPLVLWLQDLLPDGAVATGLVREGALLRVSRRIEREAYRRADRIVTVSGAFERSIEARGVERGKLATVHNPATLEMRPEPRPARPLDAPRVLSMGNIGLSQGLAPLVRAFESSPELAQLGARLTVTGHGVAAEEVRAEVVSPRVEMPGVVDAERLARELERADIGLVSQRYDGVEFNLPSKLANFMAGGIPVLAAVHPEGEVARIVRDAEGGWVVDGAQPEQFTRKLAEALRAPEELQRRGANAHAFARRHFSPHEFGERFDSLLAKLISGRRSS